MKELPVYVITVGKNGPKLKQARESADGRENHGGGGSTTVPTLDGTRRIRLDFNASSLQEAADTFSWYFDRRVLDRTGLKGSYDFVIEFEEDPETRVPQNPFSGLTRSALSAALQSVGLRLDATKAATEVLVIDHVEKPSEN